MAENESKFQNTVESLFDGMDGFISAKTVVGEVIQINGSVIVPLVDVSFGVGAGAWEKADKNSAGGGLGGKMHPTAVLVISNGTARIIPVNQPQDAVSKIIDLVPELINKFTSKDKDKLDPEVEEAVDDIIDEAKKEEEKAEKA